MSMSVACTLLLLLLLLLLHFAGAEPATDACLPDVEKFGLTQVCTYTGDKPRVVTDCITVFPPNSFLLIHKLNSDTCK